MQQSIFNLRVPLSETGEVFLMNTLTDAQLIVLPTSLGCSIVCRRTRNRLRTTG